MIYLFSTLLHIDPFPFPDAICLSSSIHTAYIHLLFLGFLSMPFKLLLSDIIYGRLGSHLHILVSIYEHGTQICNW